MKRLRIVTSREKSKRILVDEILESELHNDWRGTMMGWSYDFKDHPKEITGIGVAYWGELPVGSIIFINRPGLHWKVGVWVHPDYRRQGIGTTLLLRLVNRYPKHDWEAGCDKSASYGITWRRDFFDKVNSTKK
jgi:GNAT superfamily N-acetyltransferase